jgi:hypothetical protein
LTSNFDVEYLDVKIQDRGGGGKMRLDHPEIHTETHRLRDRELRGAAERHRATTRRRPPLGRGGATLGSWLRALADRLDPATQLNRGGVT